MQLIQSRRRFLAAASMAGAASLFGVGRSIAAASDPPPETTTIRLGAPAAACNGPLMMAEELLYEEGFTKVLYGPAVMNGAAILADGENDIDQLSWSDFLPIMDAAGSVTVLAGVQVGCMELRADESIRSVRDLHGKRVGINGLGVTDHMLVSMMAAYVGLKPASDIEWVINSSVSQAELFNAGKVDAFIGFPPDPGQPCASNAGHVVVNIAHDRPWSDYFCCMAIANTNFVRNNPVATKRALRAILKATDICHQHPEQVAKRMASAGFSYECALMVLKDANYGLWREFDPEDTVRFYTLRLHELGMIKKTPNEVISGFTDWRFLREVKKELA